MRQTYSSQHYRVDPPSWSSIPVLKPIEAACRLLGQELIEPSLPVACELCEQTDDECGCRECDWCGRMCSPQNIMKSKVGCSHCCGGNQQED